MKMKDVEVGKDYAYSRARNPGGLSYFRVKVISKEQYRRVWESGAYRSHRSVRPDGVEVEFLKDDGTPILYFDGTPKKPEVVPANQIVMDWEKAISIKQEAQARIEAKASTIRQNEKTVERLREDIRRILQLSDDTSWGYPRLYFGEALIGVDILEELVRLAEKGASR